MTQSADSGRGEGVSKSVQTVDVAVVGAGFAGLYLLHRLRKAGFSVVALDTAGDVGGTWYWNRYPGARCDIQTIDYRYTFDPELDEVWTWSEKYATQPEILDYLRFVANRYDLRRDIRFETGVEAARWDEADERWRLSTSAGPDVSCRFYIMATGCLSAPKAPEYRGVERFRGPKLTTGRWPHEGFDFTGKRVAVIGTGSSAIQTIPIVAEQAAELVVFQRTPNFSLPARNGAPSEDRRAQREADREAYVQAARQSPTGVPFPMQTDYSFALGEEERRRRFERVWAEGDLVATLATLWADSGNDLEGNNRLCELVREKIREIVKDPETAETLTPRDHPLGSKRPCLDTNYYATFNRPNVRLVDLRREPITEVDEHAIHTARRAYEVDVIVFATGFDAMTGAVLAIHPVEGRDGRTLQQHWANGPRTYLGLTAAGFPNFFMITGPGSPSVLSNMAVSIEQHVDWVVDRLIDVRGAGFTTIEPTALAEAGWERHCRDCEQLTLHRLGASWYTGANVVGKPRGVMPYTGGVGGYRSICDEVAARGMLGFRLTGLNGEEQCYDGEIVRLQPDVRIVLGMLAAANLPEIESLGAEGARAFLAQFNAGRPPVRPIGEVVDGEYPGAAGPLRYRLFRPASPGPHQVVLYFHGGGWVLGDAVSDEPFLHDLCRRSDMAIVSVDYRHAPENPFPAAAEDAYAAAVWASDHRQALGGGSAPILVAGWSAGGNLAAVACQTARDRGGPQIAGQALICPVTDFDTSRPSYAENGEGYFLTRSLMNWFMDNYVSPADRTDPRAAPLRGNLAGLPPALVVTAEFDPLRDEGVAYAEGLAKAGVGVEQIKAHGHFHLSFHMVDVIATAVPARERIAATLRRFAGLPPKVEKPVFAPVAIAAE